ncbi:MAG: YbhB/YbcL family Raf kinase inhibitor-like protein [Alphaproteobacteria bacterium]|nr:YbhB/YbcL family Raf kinase inhibitor-like protein [Alphaproteobacteria bacterium]
MKKILFTCAASSLLCSPAYALKVDLGGIGKGDRIPPNFAFCMPDGKGKTKNGGNLNPQIRWSGAPKGTKSFALLVVDPDVPASFDDANKEGKTLPADMPRQDFYHWVLVDIPADVTSIKQGQDSSGYKQTGKPVGKTSYGVNGQNDYASFMKGSFGGYDGPCPPWNDERLHHYHFRIYALDTPSLDLSGNFTGKQAMEAIGKHTMATAEAVGTYSNRP